MQGAPSQSFANGPHVEADATDVITNGPYVFVTNDDLDIKWVCNNTAQSISIKTSSLPYSFSDCGLQASLASLVLAEQKITYSGNFTIAAFSGLHGQYNLMFSLLRNNHIIDENNKWRFAGNHVVIAGDVFGRGDKVT